ncbi:MAG: methylaspartate mutase subunit S, partial [Hafnia alvei]
GMGFNRVFAPDTDLELVCSLMRKDIEPVMQNERVAEGVQ